MQYHRLSKSDAKRLVETVRRAGIEVSGEQAAVMIEESARLYDIGGTIILESGGRYLPIVDESVNRDALRYLPSVIVDMGAVKHVVNGADIMRPGIVAFESKFSRDDLVVVRDVKNRKPLAVCRALMSSDEAMALSRGKVLENIHHVGDKYWQLSRKLIELNR